MLCNKYWYKVILLSNLIKYFRNYLVSVEFTVINSLPHLDANVFGRPYSHLLTLFCWFDLQSLGFPQITNAIKFCHFSNEPFHIISLHNSSDGFFSFENNLKKKNYKQFPFCISETGRFVLYKYVCIMYVKCGTRLQMLLNEKWYYFYFYFCLFLFEKLKKKLYEYNINFFRIASLCAK